MRQLVGRELKREAQAEKGECTDHQVVAPGDAVRTATEDGDVAGDIQVKTATEFASAHLGRQQ